jgi:hypothetical protein
MVLAFIPRIHLEDHLRYNRLTGKQANMLVQRNLETIAQIVSAKYERGEFRPYSRSGSTLPRVDIGLADIEASEEKLSTDVLNAAGGWATPDGRW